GHVFLVATARVGGQAERIVGGEHQASPGAQRAGGLAQGRKSVLLGTQEHRAVEAEGRRERARVQGQGAQVGADQMRGGGLHCSLFQQEGAAIDPDRIGMALCDHCLQMPPVSAAEVGHRLAALHLGEPEGGSHVLPREPWRRVAARDLEEEPIRYGIHSSAHFSSAPITRPWARPLSVRWYSTRTGWSSMTRRWMTPPRSSSLSRWESIPSVTTSSSERSSL